MKKDLSPVMNRSSLKRVALVVLLAYYSSVVAPVGAQSLKLVPSNEEIFNLLLNPVGPQPPRSFPGVPGLFPLAELPRDQNPLTGLQAMLVDPVTGAICFGTNPQEPTCPPGLSDPPPAPLARCFIDPTPPWPQCTAAPALLVDFPVTGVPAMIGAFAWNPAPPFGTGPVAVPPAYGGDHNRALKLPPNENDFFLDRAAAVRLGKALFWDMQVGSDGVQSCGTCHFHAGADNRTKNQLTPGVLAVPADNTLQLHGPTANQEVVASDFPFHKLANILATGEPSPAPNPPTVVTFDTNDVMSSMGVIFSPFTDILTPGAGAFIPGTVPPALLPDIRTAGAIDPVPVFQNLRRVEPRNTPTLFGAGFNFNNFWDGRARHDFNGGSVFGPADPQSHIFVDTASPLPANWLPDPPNPVTCSAAVGALQACRVLIRFSSMASLATGPVLSEFEMSFRGRNWGKVGKKLLQGTLAPSATSVTPLANQLVSTTDSVLGGLSNGATPGLSTTYQAMIQAAFKSEFHSNVTDHLVITPAACPGIGCDPFDGATLVLATGAASPTDTFQLTQMEANFSLFFGLAVQAWVQTLSPNHSDFDQFHDANPNEFRGIVNNTHNAAQLAAAGTVNGAPFVVSVVGMSPRQLYGYDLFQLSNLSLLNIQGKSGNCNLCHVGPALTSNAVDFVQGTTGANALGEPVVMTGLFLEDTVLNNAPTAVELDNINAPLAVLGQPDQLPTRISILDEGIYNIGVRPSNNDLGRGINDPFGFPLSLAALALQNEGCQVGTNVPLCTGVSALPATLAPFANPFPLGAAFPLINVPLFLPDVVNPTGAQIPPLPLFPPFSTASFPNPNQVARMGSFKVSHLKNVELTGPYFHNGGMLTLRQVIDFYSRGGDFPVTNAPDRDVLMINFNAGAPGEALTEDDKDALVDFLLAMTDPRVRIESAPFDHPEMIVPLDGAAQDNTGGRAALLANPWFRQVPAVGAAGGPALPNFLGISSVRGGSGPSHFSSVISALTVTKAGAGSGTVTSNPAGIACGPTCSAPYDGSTPPANVTLTAVAAAGSSFTGWSGVLGCPGTGTCVVGMTVARNVTATFSLLTLTVTKAGTGSGTVTSVPAGIACGPTCSALFAQGTSVTLTAVAAAGSPFIGWIGEGCSGTGTCVVSMTVARNVTATFSIPGPDLTGSSTGVTKTCAASPPSLRCTIAGKFTIRNVGARPAGASTLRIYVSSDIIPGNAGDLLLQQKAIVSIGVGGSVTVFFSVQTPNGVNPAGRFLIGQIDATNAVVETNEANNNILFGPLP